MHNLISDKKFSEILTGSVWALGARVSATVLALVSSVIIARFYGAEMVGVVAVVNSFLILATTFTVFGTNTSILRLIPEYLAKYSPTSAFKVYRKTQYMVIGFSLLTGTLFYFSANFIAAKIFNKPHLSIYFAIASIFIVFKSLMLLNTSAVRGLRLIRVFAMMQMLPQGFNLLLLIALGILTAQPGVPVYALLCGYALTGIFGWGIMNYTFKRRIQPGDKLHPTSTKKILAISLPMLMVATMNFFIAQTGVIMLGMFRTEAEVGYYSIAVKLSTLTSFVLSAINTISAPKFSELFHSGKIDELFYVAKKSTKLIFYATVPILFFLLIFGKLVLSILFGAEFTVAYTALLILIIGQFINSISGSIGYFMNMIGYHNQLRNILFSAAALNILFAFVLIPKIGINGAAIASMLCLVFWNISALTYIYKKYGRTTTYIPFID